ncbi:MAG: alanine racemase [Bradymonadia bacterium]|jgi:alanine racemase
MTPLSAGELARVVGGQVHGDAEVIVRRAQTDTRGALRAGDVFFALSGPRFDGDAFVRSALSVGASAVVTRTPVDVVPGQACIVVPNVLAAMHLLARHERERFEGIVVAITGSNGKTVTKQMLVACLSPTVSVSASPASFNSQVGVALSLLHMESDADVAIIECGISQVGEMERLATLVRPDVGIFVNVGLAHQEGLPTLGVVAEEKAKLFDSSLLWVLVPEVEHLAQHALAARSVKTVTVSTKQEMPIGSAQVLQVDASLALEAALRLGAEESSARQGLSEWRAAPMRLELSTTPRGLRLINDAYNADPTSMESALVALSREPTTGRRIAVLGTMAQLGARAKAAHLEAGHRAVELGADCVIGIGEGGGWIVDGARQAGLAVKNAVAVPSIEGASSALENATSPGDVVLLKASRPERLERLASLLFESVSPARLEVDLQAIRENYRTLARVAGGAEVMPVVKSFGYGLGAIPVARLLVEEGAAAFCVAYPDEGVALRDAGITVPILVQNVLVSEVDKVVRFGLSASVVDRSQVGALHAEAAAQARRVPIHLKVDTGMGRSGVFPEHALDVARRVAASDSLKLVGLMTHLACSEDPTRDDVTGKQLDVFEAVVADLAASGITPRWIHAANSAAILRHPRARFSLVRAGIALYGFGPSGPGTTLSPTIRLSTRLISVKELPPGHGLGYGLTWRVGEEPCRIALAAIGYSDGYPRSLSNRGVMSVGGILCPVVGQVCMDVTMLDVSAVDDVSAGDEVVVFDDATVGLGVAEHAALAGTIPYEILTRISERVRRVFRREA